MPKTLIPADPVKALRASLLAKRASEISLDDLTAAVSAKPDAKAEAIAQADAELSNVGLPTYGELVEALNKLRFGPVFHKVAEDDEKHWPQIAAADALLARAAA